MLFSDYIVDTIIVICILMAAIRYEQEMRVRFEEDLNVERTALDQGFCSPFIREKDPMQYNSERANIRYHKKLL